MPDDYPAAITDGKAEHRLGVEFDAILSSFGLAENPRPSKYKKITFTAADEKRERDRVRRVVETYDDDLIIRMIVAHIKKEGNLKLPKEYLVWNMTSAHACPALTFTRDGLIDMSRSTCQAFRVPPEDIEGDFVAPDVDRGVFDCYAWRGENFMPEVWPFRTRQNEIWELVVKDNPEYMFKAVVKTCLMTKGKPRVALRFSEGGDFPDQHSVDVFAWLAEQFGRYIHTPRAWGLPFITYTYTARDTLDFSGIPAAKTAVVMGSSFKSRGVTGEFRYVIDEDEGPSESGKGSRWGRWPTKKWSMCLMNCRGCRRCLLGLDTRVLRHGPNR